MVAVFGSVPLIMFGGVAGVPMARVLVLIGLVLTVVSGGSGCAQGCPAALLTGVLTEEAGEAVVIPDGGGPSERIIWPSGHSVGRDGDDVVVTNMLGEVVAREGDRVELGGGERESGVWVVCGLFGVHHIAARHVRTLTFVRANPA